MFNELKQMIHEQNENFSKRCVCVKVAQSCPTLCDLMDYTVHGILQARVLEWVAFPSSRGSSQPRDRTQVSHIAGGFFTSWATRDRKGLFKKIFFPIIFISWRLTTLQYCSGFCHTLTWISHGFTCVSHPEPEHSQLPPHIKRKKERKKERNVGAEEYNNRTENSLEGFNIRLHKWNRDSVK